MRKLLFALALLLALPAQAQPVPPVEGFRIPYSAVWIATYPCDGAEIVYRVDLSQSGYPMPAWHIKPFLDQRITIVGYELMKTPGCTHNFFMLGNNYIGDDKLQLSAGDDHDRIWYPWGYGDPFPSSSEASSSVYIDLHGLATGGGYGSIWITLHYLLNEDAEDYGAAVDLSLNADANSYQGYTAVQCFEPNATTDPTGSQTIIRATVEAAQAAALKVKSVYAGAGGNDCSTFNFTDTPAQLKFANQSHGHVSVGAKRETDWTAYTYDNTKALLIAFDIDDATYNRFRAKASQSGARAYWKVGNEAGSTSKSGYTEGWNLLGITKIEMDGY